MGVAVDIGSVLRVSLGLTGLCVVGCGAEVDEPAPIETGTDTGDVVEDIPDHLGYVRVIHLVPDLPTMDLGTNASGVVLAGDFPYPGSSPSVPFPPGTYSLEFHQPAEDGGPTGETLLQVAGVEVSAGQHYTVAGWGFLADASAGGLVLEDDRTPASSGNFKARFVHACTPCGTVDLWSLDGEVPTRLADDLAPGDATPYFEIPADQEQTWLFDINNDGVPDWQLEPFQAAEVDTVGNGQVISLFLQPLIDPTSGNFVRIPGTSVVGPWLVTQPLDASAETQVAILPPS